MAYTAVGPVFIGKKVYTAYRDAKGRVGIWLTLRGRRVFIPLSRIYKTATAGAVVSTLARWGLLLEAADLAERAVRKKRGKEKRSWFIFTLSATLAYALMKMGAHLLEYVHTKRLFSGSRGEVVRKLKQALGENFVASYEPGRVPRYVPVGLKPWCKNLTFIEVHNPYVAFEVLKGSAPKLSPRELYDSPIGAFRVGEYVFFSRNAQIKSGELTLTTRSTLAGVIADAAYDRIETKAPNLVKEWERAYEEVTDAVFRKLREEYEIDVPRFIRSLFYVDGRTTFTAVTAFKYEEKLDDLAKVLKEAWDDIPPKYAHIKDLYNRLAEVAAS